MKRLELRIYNAALTPLGIVDEIESLLWTPTYWNEGSSGDMRLLVPFTKNNMSLLKKGNIVVKHDSQPDHETKEGSWYRAVEIQYRHIVKDINGGEQIEIQGCFLKKWLSKRVILNKIAMKGTEQEKINRIVRENLGQEAAEKRRFERFVILAQEDLGGESTDYASEDYTDAGLEVYNRALTGKLGYDILVNQRTGMYGFYLYKGSDLTSDNKAGNTPCIFSRDFDNANEQEYTESTENVKNAVYVSGAADINGNVPFMEIGNISAGIQRNEIYQELSGTGRTYMENETEKTMSEEEYRAALLEAGKAALENYYETASFVSSINAAGNLIYKKDFNLGDRITCVENKWGIKINARITEVCETYQNGIKEIEVTLGESLPTLIQKIRKMR